MLNKVTLIGRLCADPESRFMPNGGQVTTIRLATNRRWRDKQTNERKEETEFHRVIFFSRLAEVAGEYLKKGSQCYVQGRIRTQKWQDQQGQDRYSTEIVAEELHMLDSRSGDNAGQGASQTHRGDGTAYSTGRQGPATPNQANPNPPGNYDDFDDDIPFIFAYKSISYAI